MAKEKRTSKRDMTSKQRERAKKRVDAFDPSNYGEPGDILKFVAVLPIEQPDETGHMWMVGSIPFGEGGVPRLYDSPEEARAAVGHEHCVIMVVNLNDLPIPDELLTPEEQLAQAEAMVQRFAKRAARLRDKILSTI